MSSDDVSETNMLDIFSRASRELHDSTNSLIQRQWRSLMVAGILLIAAVLITIWSVFYFMRTPEHGEQLEALSKASHQLELFASTFATASLTCSDPAQKKVCEDAKTAIAKYSSDYQKVADSLRSNDRQPKPEALSLIQLVGGTAILAVLGYLGLMRLQNLDQELHNLRTFMFEQISARVKELRGTIQHDVSNEISGKVEQMVERALNQTTEISEEVKKIGANTKEEISKSEQAALEKIREVSEKLSETLKQYPWLNNLQLRDGLAKLDNIPSVEKAYELSTELTSQRDEVSAIEVLKTIVEKNLPGDKADFHNSYSQSMSLHNPALALKIVDKGLTSFPDDYDLMADKAKALIALGRPSEAKRLLEDWAARKPDEFARGWRPVVFYAEAVEAGALDADTVEKLITTFKKVVDHAPHEGKAWSAFGRFMSKLGRTKDAVDVLQKGIKHNPFSQKLHFVLGETYLRTGDAAKAVTELETAVRYDYQDQFQSDVNQHAVLCMLAQAYEADKKTDQAVRLYQAVVSQGARGSILTYAQQRLRVLSALEGRSIEIPEGTSPLAQLAKLLKEHHEISDQDRDS